MTDIVPDEKETVIACELTQAPNFTQVPVFKSAKDAEGAKGSYHYKLWLPQGYSAAPLKRWPCLFVMSPGGNASMGNMQAYLKTKGFVVVMLVEAKNGPWEPIVGNFLAAHDDVIKRVRIQDGKKYATGMSGGGRGSSVFVQTRPGFSGLLLQGAGASFDDKGNYNAAGIKRNPGLYVAMTMGLTDTNKPEVDRMKQTIDPKHFAAFDFTGGHTWAPAETFEKAMGWLTEKTPSK